MARHAGQVMRHRTVETTTARALHAPEEEQRRQQQQQRYHHSRGTTIASNGPRYSLLYQSPGTSYLYYYYYPIGSQRLWSVITLSMESILILTVLLSWLSTREDTLAGFMSVMFASLLFVNTIYHVICFLYHRVGELSIAWYGFIGVALIFITFTLVTVELSILYPFVHRFFQELSGTPSLLTVLYIVLLTLFAEYLAQTRLTPHITVN
jgi:hypothetical protein